ncbi:fimbrial biogenesis chaperone [Deinococcus cellulosilyticus]|uniref:Pili assembly chaperone N-terminal domain-containing protein n=1 Tax=Deinococcus cellulosilyticus (strain DSM 18568 / NBRC 106333 / KACC 11606 / 5516J-15) TaxID=1223518 RepID=A0A511N6Q1_DEIC1|nr:fimbria/pilus periplasmic chaperone [Deinococcus cellulosilyticus]GEM48540.1 hypothetical protein DC3_41750 [Deinococcus cellulosilyticus NBRC 106333 = KACC 11606]
MINRKRLLSLGTLSMILFWPSSAWAINFSLNPVVLEINPQKQLNTQTKLVNLEGVPVAFTVEVFKWTQQNGQDVYSPTRDVLVNPVQFTLAPRGSQVIRVGLRKKPDQPELTYRIFIKEVPATLPKASAAAQGAATATSASITTVLNIGVPFYVTDASSRADLKTSALLRDGVVVLQATNQGSRREVMRNPLLQAAGKELRLDSRAVLGQSFITYVLKDLPANTRSVTLTYTDNQGKEHSETLDVQQ